MKNSKKTFAELAEKMETLTESNQGKLKGGFSSLSFDSIKGSSGSVSVSVTGNCGCGCKSN